MVEVRQWRGGGPGEDDERTVGDRSLPSIGPTIASEAIIYAVGGRHVHTPGTPTSHGEVHSLCTTAEISDRIGSDRIGSSNRMYRSLIT